MRTLSLGFALLAIGCGGRSYPPSETIYDFPTRQRITQLQRIPMPTPVFQDETVQAEGWRLEGPFPAEAAEPDSSLTDRTPWDDAVPADAAVEMRPAMRCAAREMGRFALAHGGLPTHAHQRFMRVRCGVTAADVLHAGHLATVDAHTPATELQQAWLESTRRQLAETMREGRWTAGTWFGREENRTVLVVLVAKPRVVFSADSPRTDASGRVRIRGRVLGPVGHVEALVNQGARGVERCRQDPRLALPDFQLECQMAPGDEHALVDVQLFEPGRYLGLTGAQLLARRPDAEALAYSPVHVGVDSGVTVASGADAMGRAIIERVNRFRAEWRLQPLRFEREQSRVAGRIAPHFFAASRGQADPERADEIALSLAAGWDVQGVIRDARFTAASVPSGVDATWWLRDALSQPTGRRTLLDADLRSIALGGAPGEGGLGLLVTTYAFFDDTGDIEQVEDRVAQHVANERARRGLAPLAVVVGFEEFGEEVDRMRSDGKAPGAVLDAVLSRSVADFNRSMKGWVLESGAPDRFDVPSELLQPGPAYLLVEATWHRPPGAAWGQWVVFLLTPVD